ncbi:hypothetical protein LBMAG15_18180 [Actinomycetes bacterium]|nr:hypothetical protein LBMAG15_18180 [Actinomycetes bacterium]
MPVTHNWALPADTSAAAAARGLVESSLATWGDGADAVSIVSELCTNAILHGSPPQTLKLVIDTDNLHLEVTNGKGPTGTVPQVAAQGSGIAATGGHGLRLVAALATSWGTDISPELITVWADIAR